MTIFLSLDVIIYLFSRIHSYFITYKHIQRVAESATANIFSWKAWLAVPLAIPSLCPGSCREAGSVYTRSHSFPSVHFAYLSFHVIRAGRPLPSFGPPPPLLRPALRSRFVSLASGPWLRRKSISHAGPSETLTQSSLCVRRSSRSSAIDEISVRPA